MTIGILEVAGISAPESCVRFLDYLRAGLSCPLHDSIDFLIVADVVTDCEFGGALRAFSDPRIIGYVASRPERELQARLQIKKGHGAVLEFLSKDSLGRKPEAVAIER